MQDLTSYSDQALTLLMAYGPNLILAILTLAVGLWVIKAIVKALARTFEKKEYDPSLETFILSLTRILLKVLLVISVVGMLGVQMTSFIAILGAAGLAVGLALSGTLQNFAGGVMILIFKPFKVGDVLEAQGFIGSVKAIQIFNTILKTPDNKTIILPNAPLSAGTMVNYSTEATRRVDLSFGIGYDDDIDQAKAAIQALADADDRILKDPAPFIAVSELADSSVNFVVRLWVNSVDYWGVHFDMIEAVKKEFDRRNISIPYPQRDVHMHTVGPAA
jgi:small conductance mechanosensitive channel